MLDRLAAYFVDNQISTHLVNFSTVLHKCCRLNCLLKPSPLPRSDANRELFVGFSAITLAIMHGLHLLVPRLQPTTQKLFQVSYYNSATGSYGKGPDDAYLVFYWIVMFTFLRATAVDYIFMPFARRGGISTKKDLIRFAEQAWLLVYYSVFWTLGMVCHLIAFDKIPLQVRTRTRTSLVWATNDEQSLSVFDVQQPLLDEPYPTLDRLAFARTGWHLQVVLLGAVCVLAAANIRPEY
jgi:hypothetical protein